MTREFLSRGEVPRDEQPAASRPAKRLKRGPPEDERPGGQLAAQPRPQVHARNEKAPEEEREIQEEEQDEHETRREEQGWEKKEAESSVQDRQGRLIRAEQEKAKKGGYSFSRDVAKGHAQLKIEDSGHTLILSSQHDAIEFGLKYEVVNLKGKMPREVAQKYFKDDEAAVKRVTKSAMEDKDFHQEELTKAPARTTIDQYEAWASHINDLLKVHDTVVINCNHGRTRTPIVAAAYLWLYERGSSVTKGLPLDGRKAKVAAVGEIAARVAAVIKDQRKCEYVLGESGAKMVNLLQEAVSKRDNWA